MKYFAALGGIIVVAIIAFCLTSIYKIDTDEMEPVISKGSFLFVDKYEYTDADPKFGEVIVFKNMKMLERSINRIVGCPGDAVEITNGILMHNNKVIKEEYLNIPSAVSMPKVTVPRDKYFVLNDNREKTSDSRSKQVGFVGKKEIIGRVVLVF